MKPVIRAMITCLMFTSLCGCWDMKDIQYVNVVTALAIEYENKQFVIHARIADISAWAKSESGSSSANEMVTAVGIGKGTTIAMAMNDLYRTAQQQTSWNHVNAIYFSDSALEYGLLPIHEQLMQFRETRYTPWVFSTNKPVKELMVARPIFKRSDLYMNHPDKLFDQQSYIPPVHLNEVIRTMREPTETTLIPTINFKENWLTQPNTTTRKAYMNGAVALRDGKKLDWLSIAQLNGVRWMNGETVNTFIKIKRPEAQDIVLQMHAPKIDKHIRLDQAGWTAVCDISVHGSVFDLHEDISLPLVKKLTSKAIKKQVVNTFEIAKEHNIDVYNMERNFYFKHPHKWRQAFAKGGNSIQNGKIEVKVHVYLENMEMYRFDFKKQ